MPTPTSTTTSDVRLVAALGAGALVAQQVLGKSARDALFLSQFPVSRLPLAMTCGAVLSGAVVLVSSLVLVSLQRACEGALRASLFRAAYEALFTPVASELKRPSKTLIDVGFDRIGTILGGLITLAIVGLGTAEATRWVTLFAVAASVVTMLVCLRVHGGYVATLTERLRDGKLTLEDSDALDRTTRLTLSRTMQGLDRRELLARIEEMNRPALQRDDTERVRTELTTMPIMDDVQSVIALLARAELATDVAMALAPHASRIAGQLGDVLLDDTRSPALRRRCARVLSRASSPLSLSVLLLGLSADDITVRKACARSLVAVCASTQASVASREPVLVAVGQLLHVPADADLALEKARVGYWSYSDPGNSSYSDAYIRMELDADRYLHVTSQPHVSIFDDVTKYQDEWTDYYVTDADGTIHGTNPSGVEELTQPAQDVDGGGPDLCDDQGNNCVLLHKGN